MSPAEGSKISGRRTARAAGGILVALASRFRGLGCPGIYHEIATHSHSLSKELTGDYSTSMIDKVEKINQKLKGWSQFYCYTDYTSQIYRKIDRVVFWKLARWLARKYRCSVKSLLKRWCKHPETGKAKTWVLFGKTNNGNLCGETLFRLVSSSKMRFRWRLPEINPYLREEERKTISSCYEDVALAVGHG